jgi:hypothetical protein
MSDLRDTLDNYLTIRRALGYKLARTGLLLADFVSYLDANGTDTITTDAAFTWATLPPDGTSDWWAQRLSVVRPFARHLHAIDPAHEVPPPGLLPGRSHRATPYLYSDADIAALMAAAQGFRSPLRVATFETLVGLLAVTRPARPARRSGRPHRRHRHRDHRRLQQRSRRRDRDGHTRRDRCSR